MSVAASGLPRAPERAQDARHTTEVLSRLNKAHGQPAGISSIYADGHYCIDVLDQPRPSLRRSARSRYSS